MDELTKKMSEIRLREVRCRRRDTYGRYEVEDPVGVRRDITLNVRLTEGERHYIRTIACQSGKTITRLLLDAVRYYSSLME